MTEWLTKFWCFKSPEILSQANEAAREIGALRHETLNLRRHIPAIQTVDSITRAARNREYPTHLLPYESSTANVNTAIAIAPKSIICELPTFNVAHEHSKVKIHHLDSSPNNQVDPSAHKRSYKNYVFVSHDGMLTSHDSLNRLTINNTPLEQGASAKLANGDIVAMENAGHFVYDAGQLHDVSPEKAQLLQKLFPSGISKTEFKQQTLGNCIMLATLKAMMHNNPKTLLDQIELKSNKDVIVHFQHNVLPPAQRTIEQLGQILLDHERQAVIKPVAGPLGAQLLESALGSSLRGHQQNHKNGASTYRSLDESWNLHPQYFKALTGKSGREISFGKGAEEYIPYVASALQRIDDNPRDQIGIVGTPTTVPFESREKYSELGLMPHHAYAILNSNIKDNVITFCDPFDTATHKYVDLQSFHSIFDVLWTLDCSK